jgi:hypothetical protein
MKVVVCVDPAALGGAARAALALAARLAPGTVAALAASAAPGGKGLIDARRWGAARAVEVVGPGLDGSDADALGRALAEAARGLGAELVLTGTRSDREGRGIVGAAVAHHLGAPYLANIEALAVEAPGEVVVTIRSGGWRRRLAVSLPAVLTVAASALPADAVEDSPDGEGEVMRIEVAGIRPSPALLGTLDRFRRKPEIVASASELVKRWRSGD